MNFADRVEESTTTTGTGDIALSGTAPAGLRPFSQAFAVGTAEIPYCIEDATKANWEIGLGTLSASGVLVRNSILSSSNANAAVDFAAGTKRVFCTLSAALLAEFGRNLSAPASTTMVLDAAFRQYGQINVSGPTTIAITGTKPGASAAAVVIANGVNVPAITGADEWGTSFGYLNTLGIPNRLDAWHDGVAARYGWSQQAVPVALVAPSAPVLGTLTLDPAQVGSTVTFSTPSVSGSPSPSVTYALYLNGSLLQSGVSSGSYTLLAAAAGGSLTVVATATNSAGTDTRTSNAVTVASGNTAPTLGAFTLNAVQAGTAVTFSTPTVSGNPSPAVTYALWKDGALYQPGITSGSYTAQAGDVSASFAVVATATNAAGTDTETSNAAVVSAATPAAAIVLMADLNLLSKSDDTYTGLTGTNWDQRGTSGALKLAAGADGYISVDWPNASGGAVLFGFDATRMAAPLYSNIDYQCQLSTNTGNLSQGQSAAVVTAVGAALTPAAGVRYRMARTAGTITIDQSADSGATWTTRYTFAGTNTGDLYGYWFTIASNKIVNPRQFGMA